MLLPGQFREPPIARYYYVLKDDHIVEEFCVAVDGGDPNQYVETLAPDGTAQRWTRRTRGDLLVFLPPDGYSGAQGMLWVYDKRLQSGQAMPRAELERRALNMRISIQVPEMLRV